MKKERNENRNLPEPIRNSTPEQVAQVIMQKPPKKEWRFMGKEDSVKQLRYGASLIRVGKARISFSRI